MTTATDLFIISVDLDHSVGQGDLSLALAGAELIDLISSASDVTLDGDLIVPGGPAAPADRLLAGAWSVLDGQAPYERVEDWLWRRGHDLSAAYQTALEENGLLRQQRRGRSPFGAERVELADSPSRSRALSRWAASEPVLVALASAVGIRSEPSEDEPSLDDEAVTTVLVAVNDAVMELEAERQKRAIENTAFANLWRGP
ncbi:MULTISPECIES: GOLPH3/VPS74 family protein [Streptomyces]|uniref:GPP34 family phosphoprotein n=1 Tax=Streptomyces mutomycini TaxID=284036 RepID=A0ABW0B1D5_9ACTN|nr:MULTISPECIES: GPP34 family phosphoprotein [Streptomyces]KPC80710.1 hypothetical protein ADK82_20295 [Streptomyces sp. NRRL S-4]